MSRDYKNARAESAPTGSGGHGFLWGLLIGLTVAGVLWFQSQKPEQSAGPGTSQNPGNVETAQAIEATEPAAEPQQADPEPKTAAADEAPPERKSRFAFYKLLRDFEVVIPEEEIALNAPPPVPEVDSSNGNLNLSAGIQHKVQVGSFRSAEDAERRRAEVALLGLSTAIQTVEISPGEEWNRVFVGPLTDPREIEDTLDILAGNDFGFLVTKVKAPPVTATAERRLDSNAAPAETGQTENLETPSPAERPPAEPADGSAEASAIESLALEEPASEPARQSATALPGPGYKVQIGSFRNAEDAERRRAEIGLLGLSSTIQQVEVGAGQTWNRVFIGPLDDQAAIDDTLATLQLNGFDYLLTKVKP